MPRIIDKSIGADFSEQFAKEVETEKMRQKIIGVFKEETEKVEFADKVKKYAAEEMDKRLFRSIQYWITVIITAIITSGIGFLIAFLVWGKK